MQKKEKDQGRKRSLASFIKNGDWDRYWSTSISNVSAKTGYALIRGYPLCDLIESNISFAELVYLVLKGEFPDEKQAKMVNTLLCAIGDYNFNSMVTVSGRIITSASPDSPMPGIAAGLLSIGRTYVSPQFAGELLEEARDLMKRENLTIEETAEKTVRKFTEQGQMIPGLGHPYYRDADLRAESLRKVAEELGLMGEMTQLYEAIRLEAERVIGREISLNWPGRVACIGAELGLHPFEYTGLAAMAYMPALIAHIVEELREGVPLRIVPPILREYVGKPERPLPKKYAKKGSTQK